MRSVSKSRAGNARNLKVGRYVISRRIASGGMAAVHLGRLSGPVGFSRTVAIKRLHPTFAKDPEFVAMFLDEARLVARVRHPNVVPVLDVVAENGQLFLVMEYVEGDNLARLTKGQPTTSNGIVSGILINVLNGLHAAHEARAIGGEALDIVHRDVSPQNVLVDIDGIARVTDFGIAKATARLSNTQTGELKGKFRYMAFEQVTGGPVTRRTDIYSAGAVLWELLTGRPLIDASGLVEARRLIIGLDVVPPSRFGAEVPAAVDEVALRALSKEPQERFSTAAEMAAALEKALQPAMPSSIAAWVRARAHSALASRNQVLEELEAATGDPNADLLADHVFEIAHAATPTPLSERHTVDPITAIDEGATIPDEIPTTAYVSGAPQGPESERSATDEPTVARTLAPHVEPEREPKQRLSADSSPPAAPVTEAPRTLPEPSAEGSSVWDKRWAAAGVGILVGLLASAAVVAWLFASQRRGRNLAETPSASAAAPQSDKQPAAPAASPTQSAASTDDFEILPSPPAATDEPPAASSVPNKPKQVRRTAPTPPKTATTSTAAAPKGEPSFGSFTRN